MADRFHFRIFDTKNKEWVNKFFIDNFNNLLICNDRKEFFILDKNRFVITQSTGLVDKNGKEIFEGDILKSTVAISPTIFYIKYNKNLSQFVCVNIKNEEFYVRNLEYICLHEIIGNIYENKNLLKKE